MVRLTTSAGTDAYRTTTNASSFPLLRLPGELRNKIYGYVFDSATMRKPWESHQEPEQDQLRIITDGKGLHLSCRQVCKETAHLLKIYTILNIDCKELDSEEELCLNIDKLDCNSIDTLRLSSVFAILFSFVHLAHDLQLLHGIRVLKAFPCVKRVLLVLNGRSIGENDRNWVEIIISSLVGKEDLLIEWKSDWHNLS